jgi:SAM-dependent methyltransferase
MPEPIWLDRLEGTRLYQRARKAMNRQLISFLSRSVLQGRHDLRLAEVACGSGFGAHILAQRPEVGLSVAADLNLEDFYQAAIPHFQAAFVRADIYQPGLQRESFDLVWNSSSVEELEQPQAAVAAMAALAKPGGRVFVGVPSSHGAAGLLRRLPSARTRTWLGRVYTRRQLRELIEGSGLRVEHETTYLFGTFIGVLGRKPVRR